MLLAKHHGRRIASALLVLGLSMVVITGCPKSGGPGAKTPAATKAVGAVDVEVLQGLDEFKAAQKKFEEEAKHLQADVEKQLPKNPAEWTKAHQTLVTETRAKIQKRENELLNPLKERMEASILSVSRANKLVVVLDKRIVVYGVPDHTEDVKKLFQSKDELKLGDEVDSSKSPIGYFDQDVVRSLKVFQQMEVDLYRRKSDLEKEFQKKVVGLSPAEQEMLRRDLTIQLEAYKEQLMTTLLQQVNDSVKEVAQAQGLSLVLDKQHVLQGGRNMTSEVVDTFLKKTAAPPKSPKPTPKETP
ncbi:OmpH family outer membrane protein [bacterium]|nr:OmpH family outer membrane protein [bacterium]